MNRIFNKSRGQIMVLYAVAVAGLLAAAALGTDVAVMYVNWQKAQKVADAAALAGANYLEGGITYTGTVTSGCTGPSDSASQAACTYAVSNGLPASTVTITEPTPSTIKVVATQSSLPYYFGNVMGTSTYTVSASAVANYPGPVNGCNDCGTNMIPIGMQCAKPCTNVNSLVAGESVSFGTKFISSTVNAPGNWDWVDLSGKGSSVIGTEISDGVSGTYVVGQTIAPSPGNRANSGPVKKAFDARMKSCPTIADPCNGGNPSNIPAGDPCLVIVPAVDFTGCSGSSCTPPLTIEAFAEVYLEPDSTSQNIDGCFVKSVVGGTTTGSNGSFGPQAAPTLIQ
jgi:Putative Flp pilus-assembly TadE/G-like